MDKYTTKKCSKCKEMLPANNVYFHKHKGAKSGLRSSCKKCRSTKTTVRMTAHDVMSAIEKRRERIRTHYDKNKNEINARRRRRYKELKQAGKLSRYEYHKKYYQENKDKYKERYQLYKESGKWIEVNRKANRKRRSRINGLHYSYSEKDWLDCVEHFDNQCCYCGVVKEDLHQDHFIPLSKGGEYTKNNIVPSCKECNLRKSSKDFYDWYREYEYYSKKRERKILNYLGYKNGIQQLSIL